MGRVVLVPIGGIDFTDRIERGVPEPIFSKGIVRLDMTASVGGKLQGGVLTRKQLIFKGTGAVSHWGVNHEKNLTLFVMLLLALIVSCAPRAVHATAKAATWGRRPA